MSTRRVELVHGGSGTPDASRASTSSGSGNSSGRSSCSSRKNPCASSSSGVALSSRTWRPSAAIGATARYPGSPGCPGRRRSRCASSTTSRSMPAADRLPGQLGPLDQRLERDDRAAMDVERVEAGAEIARDVGQARRIEQREHLVVLAPQLAQPLHRERLGRDDQAALDLPRVQQPVHDQRRFDRLAQPDLVGEQPSHRDPGGGALRDVQLVREQPHPAAEERSEAAGLARRQQVQDVQARQEVLGVVDLTGGQPLEQRPVAPPRPPPSRARARRWPRPAAASRRPAGSGRAGRGPRWR